MRVRWLRAALANLDDEADYVAKDSPAAAARLVKRIHSAVQDLRRFPALGRPGRVPGTRELVIPGTPYIVPYRVREDAVEVLRGFHSARRWPKKF